jgi:ATP-dependent Clp protease ATP-binding subunit ClpC
MGERSYTRMAENALAVAGELAERRGHRLIGTEHLLLALALTNGGSFARRLLDELAVTDEIRRRVEDAIGSDASAGR